MTGRSLTMRAVRAAMAPAALAMAASLSLAGAPAAAQVPNTTQATLLDRILIEDLITSYYAHLGQTDTRAFDAFFTEDAVLDINGKLFKGRSSIHEAYRGERPSPAPRGTFHMILSNPQIEVTGDTARASFIWTGISNDTVKAPPRLAEQGREYDLLVKQGGRWMIKKRTIISDSSLQDEFDTIYTPRKDYDITKAP
ncbi:MAG TPA: nuclear transport factor 2 family protein [Sphingobium sp.]|nr:nuclear transport factor 2 family protein [Sphingobium sp.]